MKLTFRWYGDNDPVPLQYIAQIPTMSGIVSAVYDVPAGEIWSESSINMIKRQAMDVGLEFEVVESVPVHEDIKLGKPSRDRYIENYCENLRRLAKAGIRVVCYNFMPVFDWLRSDLAKQLPDGSFTLAYDDTVMAALDPSAGELSLPGWDESYTKEELRSLLAKYQGFDEEKLWEHFEYFINRVIPVCEESGIKLAIHPDDPPWGVFGLPRIMTGTDSYARLVKTNSSPANGITLCFGSLGANPGNNLVTLAQEYANRIHFVHARNIKWNKARSFEETPHPTDCGNLNMYRILKALHESGFDGYIRPDHGRMIWGESGRPGYGLYDRALGAMYIRGLWETMEQEVR